MDIGFLVIAIIAIIIPIIILYLLWKKGIRPEVSETKKFLTSSLFILLLFIFLGLIVIWGIAGLIAKGIFAFVGISLPGHVAGWFNWLIIALFLLISSVIIAREQFLLGKSLFYMAVIILFLSILEITFYITTQVFFLKGKYITTAQCTGNEFLAFTQKGTIDNLSSALSCIFSNYKPERGLQTTSGIVFWIFGMIIPMGLLAAIFRDALEGIPIFTHTGARAIFVLSITLITFRTLIAEKLLSFLAYGGAGIFSLYLGIIFTSIVYKLADKFLVAHALISSRFEKMTLEREEKEQKTIFAQMVQILQLLAKGKGFGSSNLAKIMENIEPSIASRWPHIDIFWKELIDYVSGTKLPYSEGVKLAQDLLGVLGVAIKEKVSPEEALMTLAQQGKLKELKLGF